MRIICLDVGTKRIGVAISDPLGITAQGIMTIHRKQLAADLQAIVNLINEYQAEELLIGLPLNMNGTAGPSVDMAKVLGEQIAKLIEIKITYRDERYSTKEATRTLLEGDVSRKKRKEVIDKLAAVLILQGYLDYLANQNRD